MADGAVDDAIASMVECALRSALNVVYTADCQRYGRPPRAVGRGLRAAISGGMARETVFVISTDGFLLYAAEPAAGPRGWFECEIRNRGLGEFRDKLLSGGNHRGLPTLSR